MPDLDPSTIATMTEEELAKTLEMSAAGLGDLVKTIAQNPNSTIEPSRARSDAPGRLAIAGLGEQQGERGITSGLILGATIGEGGMGIVRTGTQRSLARKVAVKTLRPEVRTEQATLRLLREAWVTGSLEHPNIVPVYDVGLDDGGSPVIVLKHIEGLEWGSIIRDAAAVKARFGASDLLEYNLRILVALCNAVSLAHARGIIHRDLKPENVMVGSFGEVYLVDWGIAVSLRADPTGRLPLASDAAEMAGTPSYMAPEMLGGMGALSERTDVYLLGAILHEVLTGSPPHVGAGFRQIVASIVLSQPRYGDDVPPELAAIAQKAMAREPTRRFASAEELRNRLEWYLGHRGSLALSAEATKRVDEMRQVINAAGEVGSVRERVYQLLAEARFGFRQAAVASDGNEAARAGLRGAIELVVGFELDRGTPEAAAAALAELDQPDRELAGRVARALRAREVDKERIARLEKLDADLDLSTGRRTRMATFVMLGVVWIVAPLVAAEVEPRSEAPPYWVMYVWTTGLIVLGLAVVKWGRESLTKTAVNRRMVAMGMITFAAQLALEIGAASLGIPFAAATILHMALWFVAIAAIAALLEPRLWPTAAGYLGAFLVAAAAPSTRWYAMSLGHVLLLANALFAWGRPSEDGGFFVRRMRQRLERLERMGGRR